MQLWEELLAPPNPLLYQHAPPVPEAAGGEATFKFPIPAVLGIHTANIK